MRPFLYEHAMTAAAAVHSGATSTAKLPVYFLAGGTTLIDLMKLDVMQPHAVVDINALERTALGKIETSPSGLRLGAMVRMGDAAEHQIIKRDYPVIAQSLALAASQQIRNMAS